MCCYSHGPERCYRCKAQDPILCHYSRIFRLLLRLLLYLLSCYLGYVLARYPGRQRCSVCHYHSQCHIHRLHRGEYQQHLRNQCWNHYARHDILLHLLDCSTASSIDSTYQASLSLCHQACRCTHRSDRVNGLVRSPSRRKWCHLRTCTNGLWSGPRLEVVVMHVLSHWFLG